MQHASDQSRDGVDTGWRIQRFGELFLRYGLALILIWIGALKFTAYEAMAIEPLVMESPLL